MRRLLAIIVLVLVVVVLIVMRYCAPPRVDLAYIDDIQMRMNPQDIPQLKNIAETHADLSVRERAIFVMTDIANRSNRGEEIVPFLKSIVHTTSHRQLRTAAYTNLDLIRESSRPEITGDLQIRVDGEIKLGNTVSMVGIASASAPIMEASFGIKRIVTLDGTGHIRPAGRAPKRFGLAAGQSHETSIDIALENEGRYGILCILKLDLDRTECVYIERSVYLTVQAETGSYEVSP